jgi:hypothetical protein
VAAGAEVVAGAEVAAGAEVGLVVGVVTGEHAAKIKANTAANVIHFR